MALETVKESDYINNLIKNNNMENADFSDKISDGSHTFNELYHHRAVLFATIVNNNKSKAGKSWLHEDGTMFEDFFIVWVETPDGSFSYHHHKEYWYLFRVDEYSKAPKWDGHTSKDVIRLTSL